jgi:hypothetical protein
MQYICAGKKWRKDNSTENGSCKEGKFEKKSFMFLSLKGNTLSIKECKCISVDSTTLNPATFFQKFS